MRVVIEDTKILTTLATLTGRNDNVEVVRDALSLYYFLAKKIMRGEKLYCGKESTNITELKVSTFDKIVSE